MSILRRQFNMASESSTGRRYHDTTDYRQYGHLVGPCAENDTEMLADLAEANDLSAELSSNLPQIDAIQDVAERAEDAGAVFVAAADTIEAGGDVSEAAVAQADQTAVGAIEDAGEVPVEVMDAIDDSERVTIAGESANGTLKFKPGYSSLRRDPRALRMAGESMLTWAKEKSNQAVTALINFYEKVCQWFGKYIGTFPNLLNRAKKIRDAAKKMSGKKQEETTWQASGNTALVLTVPDSGGNATTAPKPIYLKNYDAINTTLSDIKKLNTEFIDVIRAANDAETEMVTKFSDLNFDDDAENSLKVVKAAWDQLISTTAENIAKLKATGMGNAWAIDGADSVVKNIEAKTVTPLPKFKYFIGIELKAAGNGVDDTKVGAAFNEYNKAVDDLKAAAAPATAEKAEVKAKGAAAIEMLEKMSGVAERLGMSTAEAVLKGKTSNLNKEFDVKLLTSGQVEDVCSILVNVMDDWISFRNSKRYIKHLENLRKLDKAIKKSEERFNRGRDQRNNDSDLILPDVVTKANKLAVAITKRNSKQALTLRDLASEYVSFYNAVLDVCDKSLSAYVSNN